MGFARKTKIAAVTIATVLMMSSCTLDINKNEIMDDLNKIGGGFKDMAEEVASNGSESKEIEEIEVIVSETTEAIPEETEASEVQEVKETESEIIETTIPEETEAEVIDKNTDEEKIVETESQDSENAIDEEVSEDEETETVETEGLKGTAVLENEDYESDKKANKESEADTEVVEENKESEADTSEDTSSEKTGSAVVDKVSKDDTAVTPKPTKIPETTKAPESTKTPEPTKVPETTGRVDFSSLTETSITDGFIVEEEKFEESYGTEDETYVTFSGKRLLVTMPGNEIPATAINLMLDGFYQEAAGAYNRYCDEKQAELMLASTVTSTVNVNVNYSYVTNERIIAVKMQYEIVDGDKTSTKTELEVFDILTAARITNSDITDDVATLESILFTEYSELDLKSYDKIVLVPDEDDEFSIWMISGDKFYKEHINAEEVTTILNRFGTLIYIEK